MLLCLLFFSNMGTYHFTVFKHNRYVRPSTVSETEEEKPIDQDLAKFQEIYALLQHKHITPVLNREMIEGAIRGMLEVVDDPYTIYFNPITMENMLIQTTGSFSGIGVRIAEVDGQVIIFEVFEGAPAELAGLQESDIIIGVDGLEFNRSDEAARLLRGPSGTKVQVKVQRKGLPEPLEILITRDDIEIKTVHSQIIALDIGYIEIKQFDNHTARDFVESLAELEASTIKGLILDLRNNPGGILEEVIAVGEMIVPAGEITSIVDRHGQRLKTYYSQATPKNYGIVVLVNELSASAAEILAGALQDSGAAVLVGTPTYGKATVQHLKILDDGSGFRYTVAKYRTPSGNDLHERGLAVDYQVEMPELSSGLDPQLAYALDLITSGQLKQQGGPNSE